jgi:HD-GYP domain-containing protein (c-di-GMP phosphodiesterase class II)
MVRGEEGRPSMSSDAALAELIRGAGRTHDPDVVAALVDVVEEGAQRTGRDVSHELVGSRT